MILGVQVGLTTAETVLRGTCQKFAEHCFCPFRFLVIMCYILIEKSPFCTHFRAAEHLACGIQKTLSSPKSLIIDDERVAVSFKGFSHIVTGSRAGSPLHRVRIFQSACEVFLEGFVMERVVAQVPQRLRKAFSTLEEEETHVSRSDSLVIGFELVSPHVVK